MSHHTTRIVQSASILFINLTDNWVVAILTIISKFSSIFVFKPSYRSLGAFKYSQHQTYQVEISSFFKTK